MYNTQKVLLLVVSGQQQAVKLLGNQVIQNFNCIRWGVGLVPLNPTLFKGQLYCFFPIYTCSMIKFNL